MKKWLSSRLQRRRSLATQHSRNVFRQLLAEPLEERSMLAAFLTSQSFFGGAGDQRGTGIAINAGSIYLSGNIEPETQSPGANGLVLKYATPTSSGAAPAWSRTFDFGTNFFGIGATSEGVYPAGWNYSLSSDGVGGKEVKSILAKFNADGSNGAGIGGSVWERTPNIFGYTGVEQFTSVATAVQGASNFIYAGGGGQPASYFAATLTKYDTNGNLLTTATDPFTSVPGSSVGFGLAVLGGNVYQAGESSWQYEGDFYPRPAIWEYDPNLNFMQRAKDNTRYGQFNAITASGGSLFAVGWTAPFGGAPSTYDNLIEKYDAAGNRLWTTAFGGGNEEVLTGVVGIGNKIYAVGYTASAGAGGRDAVLLEIDPASGSILSTSNFGGAQNDQANGVATDGTNLYVVGETKSFASGGNLVGSNDVFLLTYSLPTTDVSVTGGNLVVTDIAASGKADTIDISYYSSGGNSYVRVHDPNAVLGAGAGAIQVDSHTVDVLANTISGNIQVNTVDGNDTLTVDASMKTSGKPIFFDGGNPTTGPADQLTLVSAATPVTTTTYNYTDANSGNVSIDGYVVTYSHLEPVTSTINAVNVVLNYSATAETLTVTDAGGGSVKVTSNVAAETTTFTAPSGTFVLNAGDTGDDTLNFNSLPAGFSAGSRSTARATAAQGISSTSTLLIWRPPARSR